MKHIVKTCNVWKENSLSKKQRTQFWQTKYLLPPNNICLGYTASDITETVLAALDKKKLIFYGFQSARFGLHDLQHELELLAVCCPRGNRKGKRKQHFAKKPVNP